MNLLKASEAFLTHCRDERQLSENTLAAYRQDLVEFNRRFDSSESVSITGNDLVAYANYLKGPRGLAAATVKRRLACIRCMYNWLVRKASIAASPFRSIELRVRIPARLPRCLARSDMAQLAKTAESAPDSVQLATLLLFATGARISELVSIKLADINADMKTIRIVGKGDRQRQVFLTDEKISLCLKKYIGVHHKNNSENANLFVHPSGRAFSDASIRMNIKRLSIQAGLPRIVTPHMLRHTTATALIEAGVDIRFVQRLLGHRSITTTQIYTHVSDQALQAAVSGADIFGRLRA